MAAPNMRELAEASGIVIDYSDPGIHQKLLEVSNALYGDVGANLDNRNWDAIMASSNPLQAAKDALATMYSDPNYLAENAANLAAKGYTAQQADLTYQQMEDRVGSTYNPNWSQGLGGGGGGGVGGSGSNSGASNSMPSAAPTTAPGQAGNPSLVNNVAQLYRDTFGRDADIAGLQWWQREAASGKYADLASLQAAFLGGIRGDDISAYADGAKYNSAWNSGLDANSQDLYYDASKDSWFMRQRQQQPQQPQNPIGGGVVNPNDPVPGGGGQQGPVNGGINIGGGVVGGGLVDYGPSINNGNMGGLGNTGVVYGPDGKPYSSVAAAIAAGVTNYSFTRPNAGGNGLINGADNLTNIPNAATGNANPGGLIANQNQQLFTRPTTVQLPPGVYNPFAV